MQLCRRNFEHARDLVQLAVIVCSLNNFEHVRSDGNKAAIKFILKSPPIISSDNIASVNGPLVIITTTMMMIMIN